MPTAHSALAAIIPEAEAWDDDERVGGDAAEACGPPTYEPLPWDDAEQLARITAQLAATLKR